MKTIIILGAGQFGRTARLLLNTSQLKLLAYGDNNSALWDTVLDGIPVCSVEQAAAMSPDLMLIGVTDRERTGALRRQALQAGFQGDFLLLGDLYTYFDIRSATLLRLADRILQKQVPGAAAELGVYKGELAWKLNALFPDRSLYLFDTFEGFDARDIAAETSAGYSRAAKGDFSDTSAEAVLARLPHPEQAVIRKGFFPETASGLSDVRYAFVSLDADLYAPILAGLEYFYPRLNPGGVILLHDYNNGRFRGARQAVEDYEAAHQNLPLVPLCDLHGTAVILRP